jgi:hypothetical protein
MVEIDATKRTMAYGSEATEEDNSSCSKESVSNFSAAEEADDVYNIQKFIKCMLGHIHNWWVMLLE